MFSLLVVTTTQTSARTSDARPWLVNALGLLERWLFFKRGYDGIRAFPCIPYEIQWYFSMPAVYGAEVKPRIT